MDAYARLLRDRDPAVRAAAAREWVAWEQTHVSLDPNWAPGREVRRRSLPGELRDPSSPHYWANDCFLRGADAIRERASELGGIPGVLIHGRHDISGPAITPWLLHRAWSGSELIVVEDEGHGGPKEMELATEALSALAE